MVYGATSRYKDAGRGELSADDYNYFGTQHRRITQEYNLGKQQNQFERNSARTNYLRDKGNVEREYRNRFGGFQGDYVRGGLLDSGLYRQGYDRYRQARGADLADLLSAYQQRVGALGLADRQLFSVYKSGLDDIASGEAARRSSIAEELRRAKRGL